MIGGRCCCAHFQPSSVELLICYCRLLLMVQFLHVLGAKANSGIRHPAGRLLDSFDFNAPLGCRLRTSGARLVLCSTLPPP
jgi:hypothetical protein